MKKSSKVFCLLFAVLMLFTLSVTAFAGNEANDGNIKIEVATDKGSYGATGVAEITAKITNVSGEDINNVTAQAVFDDLAPAGKRSSQTNKSVDVLKSGESFSFTYKATLDADEHDLNIFQKIILWFVRLFNGGYDVDTNNIDAVTECITEIEFGKFTAENVVQVGYDNIEYNDKEKDKLSNDDLSKINEVDESIDNLMESAEYKKISDNKLKVQAIISLLTDLENEGLIQKNSINYYEESNQIGFRYICGVSGGVYLYSFNNLIGGNSVSPVIDTEELTYSVSRTSLDESYVIPNIILTYGWDDSSSTDSIYKKWDDSVKKMSKYGSTATIYDSPSVLDYKTIFLDMDLIYIAEHGSFDSETNTYCFGVKGETVSQQTNGSYNQDLSSGLIIKRNTNIGDMYFITPQFFSHYYKQKLKNSIVFISSCSAFGKNGSIDYKFAKAFKDDCGASAVVGFNNDVWLDYALSIIDEFSFKLLSGYTAIEALNFATMKHGDNHNIWIKANEDLTAYRSDIAMTIAQYIEINPSAVPVMYGTVSSRLNVQSSTITGTVTDSETGEPISGVTVEIIDNDDVDINDSSTYVPMMTVTTNENGKYEIKLPYGSYSLAFKHEDYGYYGTSLTVNYEAYEKNITLSSKSDSATITGTVTDSTTSKPIPYVTIQLINSEDIPIWTDITNENGTFVFEEKIPYGTYTVSLTHDDYETYKYTLVVDKEEIEINVSLGTEKRTVTASGNCGADGDNVTWTLYEDGELVISGSGETNKYKDNFSDEDLSFSPFYNNDDIKKVTIKSGITSIGNYLFWSCEYLEDVIIPNTVTDIGEGAFEKCLSLNNITIGSNVVNIGDYAFYQCTNLENINLPESVKNIGKAAFRYCESLKNIVIPKKVTNIETGMFLDCISLANIQIPDSVTSIEEQAFANCESLICITGAINVNKIGSSVLMNATAYYENGGNWQDGVLYLGSAVVDNNNEINKDIVVKNDTLCIAPHAFRENSFTKIVLPEGLLHIGDRAFFGSDSLTEIEIPETVKIIYGNAFESCSSLENITFPNGVEIVGELNFCWCHKLESIIVPDGITVVDSGAFEYCYNLKSIILPNTINTIEDNAFYQCSSLESIVIPNGVANIGESAFEKCRTLTDITIPDSVTSIGANAFEQCYGLTEIKLPNNLEVLEDSLFESCSDLKSVKMPENLTTISNRAFYECYDLTAITIPKSVAYIGDESFMYCDSLISITIPESVTTIGSKAFCSCDNLSEIVVAENNKNYSSDSFGVLYNKDKTLLIQFPIGNSLANYSIPNSVLTIGDYAFYSKSFYHDSDIITIPENIVSIGNYAFGFCHYLNKYKILNPNCEIYDSSDTLFYLIDSDSTIYGYTNSTAQTYAEKYDITFVVLD